MLEINLKQHLSHHLCDKIMLEIEMLIGWLSIKKITFNISSDKIDFN